MNFLKSIFPASETTGTITVIVGKPGTGKTYLAQTVADRYVDQLTMWGGPREMHDAFLVTENQLSEMRVFVLDEPFQYGKATLDAGLKLILEQVKRRSAHLLVLLQSESCLRDLADRVGLTGPVKIIDLDAAHRKLHEPGWANVPEPITITL